METETTQPAVRHDPFKDPPPARVVSITLPISAGPAEALGLAPLAGAFMVHVRSRHLRDALKRMTRALIAGGVCLESGRRGRIRSTADAITWLLEQLAAAASSTTTAADDQHDQEDQHHG